MDLDAILIEAVRERPLIYDMESEDYKSLRKKDFAWREIASKLDITVSQCKRRWKGLRDTYHRCKKIQRSGQKIPPRNRRTWRYCDAMSFLDIFPSKKWKNDVGFSDLDESILTEEHDRESLEIDSANSLSSILHEDEEAELLNEEEPLLFEDEDDQDETQTEDKYDTEKKFDDFLQLAASSISSISKSCETILDPKGQQNSTALHFASLAAKIREANIPMTISNQIEAKVAALVFAELERYQNYVCTAEEGISSVF